MQSIQHRHETNIYGEIKLFAGTACPKLAERIAEYLRVPLSGREVLHFPNENIWVRLHKSVRGQDVYVIQTTSAPVHRNLMELLIMLQTMRLDSAGRITAVVPYLCYARSDKKDKPRVPITARLVATSTGQGGKELQEGKLEGVPLDCRLRGPVDSPKRSCDATKLLASMGIRVIENLIKLPVRVLPGSQQAPADSTADDQAADQGTDSDATSERAPVDETLKKAQDALKGLFGR